MAGSELRKLTSLMQSPHFIRTPVPARRATCDFLMHQYKSHEGTTAITLQIKIVYVPNIADFYKEAVDISLVLLYSG